MTGSDNDCLYERAHERFRLGQLAGCQKLAHLFGERCNDLRLAQHLLAFCQDVPRLRCGDFEQILTLAMCPNTGCGVVEVQVRSLDHVPDAVQSATNFDELLLDRFELLALFACEAVHLLVNHLDQFANIALGQDVLTYLVDDQSFKLAGV